jgi:hypothetical protein
MAIGLSDLNNHSSSSKDSVEVPVNESLLEFILKRKDEKKQNSRKRKVLRPWQEFSDSTKNFKIMQKFKKAETSQDKLVSVVKAKAFQLFENIDKF